jgi:predicted nucleic acid-binding Zn ribbon protein
MESLSQTSARVLRGLMAAQPTTPAKIMFAWQIAAGPSLARAASAEASTDGTLTVKAKSDAWAREIHVARPMILERMGHLLGPGVITKITVADIARQFTKSPSHHFTKSKGS